MKLLPVVAYGTAFAILAAIAQHTGKMLKRTVPKNALSSKTPYGNPLPVIVHKKVPPNQLKPGRLIIIGDVHGCYEQFQQLLDKCSYQQSVDNLILAGDLVNKGPASIQVLREFKKLGALGVRGNHDDACLAAFHMAKEGGAQVTGSKSWVMDMTEDDAEVLSQLPFSISLPESGITVVHAGLVPGLPLEHQELFNLYKMRNLEGKNWLQQLLNPSNKWITYEKPKAGSAWAKNWKGPGHVFFGHDARRRLQQEQYATGLDSGCVYGGMLTAAIIPLEHFGTANMDTQKRGVSERPLTLADLQAELVSVPGWQESACAV